jgi:hypothetical protein
LRPLRGKKKGRPEQEETEKRENLFARLQHDLILRDLCALLLNPIVQGKGGN